jgi:hypothetical protein
VVVIDKSIARTQDMNVIISGEYLCNSKSAYTPAESSRVESHESCRVKSRDAACFIFVSQALVIGRDGRNGCREIFSFSEGPGVNLRRLAL